MNLNPKDQAIFRTALLAALKAAGSVGVPEPRLQAEAAQCGFALSKPELHVELQALADYGWVAGWQPPLGGDKRWRITALGDSVLVEQNG